MISVTVLSGADRGRSFDLHSGQVLEIGRGAETHTKLRDPTISRHHCRVETADGRILLTDLGSSSGTHVNGERVDQRLLFPGDTIRIGETQLRIEQPDPENALTVPPEPANDGPSDVIDTTFELGSTSVEAGATMAADPVANQDISFVLGRTIEGYRIVRELARGKTGALFLANDESRNREVAMKIVWPSICEGKPERKRFKEAMRSMYKIRHPSIVELFRAGTSRQTFDGTQRRLCWAAMEYVQGPSFRYILDRSGVAGMLDWSIAWRAAIQIAEALEYVHSKGVVHRNISPDNILLSQAENRAKLSDLMIARALASEGDRPTVRGELVGEIAYMPPERTLGAGPLDVRSDIYSLGATLYSVVTGQPPFDSPSIPDLVNRIQADEVIGPRTFQMSISPLFEEVILRCLAKKPAHRFQSVTELLGALNKVGDYAGMSV